MRSTFTRFGAPSLLIAAAALVGCTAEEFAESEHYEEYDSDALAEQDAEGSFDEAMFDEVAFDEAAFDEAAFDEAAFDENMADAFALEADVSFAPHDGLGPGLRAAKVPPKSKDGVGAFRIHHCAPSHYLSDDPIVYPKKKGASHHHMFFGNRSTNAFTTQSSLNKATTSCPGGKRNLSAYWIPSMLDGKGKVKEPNAMRIYYKGGYALNQSSIKAAPTGLRMIAGFNLRKGQSKGAQWRGCALNNGSNKNLQGCKKGQNLQLWLSFPQCWDGKRLDSPDHMSHMAYPRLGKCPSTHPVAIPEVTYVIQWKVDSPDGTKGWRLASDMGSDYGGQSAHGDWWNAWKPQTFQAFLKGCIHAKRDCNNGNLGNGWQLVNP